MVERNSRVMVAIVCVRALLGGTLGLAVALLISALVGKAVPLAVYLILIVGFVVRLALAVAEWRTTTYQLLESELVYRSGYVNSSSLQVPWSSVRGVHVETPWLLRLFGRSELRVAHGAGETSDVHFKALSPAAIAELRTRIESTQTVGALDVRFSDDTEDFTRAGIWLYAFTHSRWYVIFPLAIAAIGLLSQFLERDIIQTSFHLWQWLTQLPVEMLIVVLAGMCALATATGVVSRLVEMSNFRIRQTEELIETRQGLLSTRTRTINAADITLLDLHQPLLFRLARRSIVRVSGGSGEGDPPNFVSPHATAQEATSAIRSVFRGHDEGTLLARSRISGLLTIGGLWIGVIILIQSLIGTAWSVAAGATLIAIVAFWIVRAPTRLFLSRDGVVEIRRGVLFRRRFLFRASSILYYESVVSPVGRWLPANKLKITIADRGTRDISVRAVPLAELHVAVQALAGLDQVGTYRYSRIPEVMEDETDDMRDDVGAMG
ncbi:PH domain-containing protein [Microbacterium maritypicum]